jgi:hypothetical protein
MVSAYIGFFQLVETYLVAVVLQAVAVPLVELLVLAWVRVSVRVALVHQLLSRASPVCHIYTSTRKKPGGVGVGYWTSVPEVLNLRLAV